MDEKGTSTRESTMTTESDRALLDYISYKSSLLLDHKSTSTRESGVAGVSYTAYCIRSVI